MAMGTQQPTLGLDALMGEGVVAFITNMETQDHRVVASTQTMALDSVVKELEKIISLMRVGFPTAFLVYFKERRWPKVETSEMHEDWANTRESVGESHIEALTQDIVWIYRDTYYAL